MSKPKSIGAYLFILFTLFSTGCASKPKIETVRPYTALGYVKRTQLPSGSAYINPIRLQALRETATSLGAQGALAWESKHVNAALNKEARYLDQVFDFNRLLMRNNVLPPIIVEAHNELALSDSNTLRKASKTYTILKPARFVTSAPTWRDYLPLHFNPPSIPSRSLLPQSSPESQVWNFYLDRGWRAGMQQAHDIFNANLNRLKRDYLGIVLYRKLLAQDMISSPVVANANLGITGNENYMRIEDEVMRITAQSALKLNSEEWKPVIPLLPPAHG